MGLNLVIAIHENGRAKDRAGPTVTRICNFLLVINSNFGRISYSFRDIDIDTLF